MITVLLVTNDPAASDHPLVHTLRAMPGLAVEIAPDLDRLEHLPDNAVVMAFIDPARPATPLSIRQEATLIAHVRGGGGLITLGATLEAWAEQRKVLSMVGLPQQILTPSAEIIAETTDLHPMTRRLDPAFAVQDAPALLADLPDDAVPLLRTVWQSHTYHLAYYRAIGDGAAVVLTLGRNPAAWHSPTLRQFVARAVGAVAGQREQRPINVAMIGYGAIGREHGTAISQVPGLHYALVCDRAEARLAEAQNTFPDVRTCLDLADVAADDSIDAVIISTPPNSHASIAAQMLRAGKHVILEKPFCLTQAEADDLIALAAQSQRVLTVYQCRRWDADYLAIQRVIASGAIGEPYHFEAFVGGFEHPCHYWHSDAEISGGAIYDWGSHYLDWLLNLVPAPVTQVRGTEHKRVWHDVTNADHTHVSLQFAGGQEADLIQSDIAAALKPKWYILGTQGAIVADWRQESIKMRKWSGDLIEDRLAASEALPIVTVHTRNAAGIIHTRQLTLPTPPLFAFHRNFANHLHNGEPLAVDPASARRNVIVMEAVRRSAAMQGATISVEV